jgi:serine/threonine-protein kinase
MDYVEGVLFDKWAAALPDDRDGLRGFLRIAFLIARALEAAHSCRYLDDAGFETVGVMHGDVKPGNIMVRADGTPALMDFMMVDVHRALDPAARQRLDARGDVSTAIFGTPGFMAPEQEHEGIVTVRTDVYGLGATLRAAAGRLSLPTDLTSLLGRMTGPLDGRPHDMGEVARLISGIAGREGLDCEEMERERSRTEQSVQRGFLSAVVSLFVRRSPISRSGDSIASAARDGVARQPYAEVPPIFRLRVLAGPQAGTVYALNSSRATVGRSRDNDFVLSGERFLSRSHFALNWSPERRTFVVIDFGSHAPVLINGEPLSGSRPLAPGDLLTIGSTQLVFESTSGSRPTHQS